MLLVLDLELVFEDVNGVGFEDCGGITSWIPSHSPYVDASQ